MITLVINFLASIVIARNLTIRDYADYSQSFLVFDLFLPILTLGIPSVVLYILPRVKENEYRSVVLEIMLSLIFIGFGFSLFLLFGGNLILSKILNNNAIATHLLTLALLPIFTYPVFIDKILIHQNKLNLNIKISSIFSIILGLGLIYFAVINKDSSLLIKYRLLISGVSLPIYIYISFKVLPFSKISISWKRIGNIFKIGVPLGLATMFGTLTRQIGNLIVSSQSTPENYAIYNIGAREIPFIGVVTGSVALIVMDQLSRYLSEGKKTEALKLFHISITTSFAILFPLLAILMINAESFIILVYGKKYINSIPVFMIYLLYLPIRSIYFGSVFISAGKTKEILIRSFFSFLGTIVSVYYFTQYYGNTGAAFGLVLISYVWATPYNLWGVKKIFDVTKISELLPLRRLASIIIITIIAILITYIFRISIQTHQNISFYIEIVVFSLVYSLLSLKYNPEITAFVKKKYEKFD